MTAALDEVIEQARKEVEAYRRLFSSDKVTTMLLRRYPREVVRRFFPELPEVEERETTRTSMPSPASKVHQRPSTPEAPRPTAVNQLLANLAIAPSPISAFPASTATNTKSSLPPPPGTALAEDLGFMYVPLIQCTLPHSNPDPDNTYTRRNGQLEVTIATSLPTVGLPYGVPARLLAIYTTREVLRTRSRDIYLERTITEFLRKLRVPVSSGRRGTVGAYFDQLQRLVNTVFTVADERSDGEGRLGLSIKKRLFADEAWYWKGSLEGAGFTLSEALFESMLHRSAPLSMDAIYNLRRSPFDLDLYAWLVYRLYSLNRKLDLPWSELALQFGQAYARERDFRFYFGASLKRVLKEYPEARVEVTATGLLLMPSRQRIASLTT